MIEEPRKRHRRWSAEDVLHEIRSIQDRSAKYNQTHFPSLYGAAARYFGSWKAAVEASGYAYSDVSRKMATGYWSREIVIRGIQALENRNSSSVRKEHGDLYSAALRTFGGWREAVEAAGFSSEKARKGGVPGTAKSEEESQ